MEGVHVGGACMAGGVHGVCVAGGACLTGGMCGREHAWQGGVHAREMALKRAVCILLECILVYI